MMDLTKMQLEQQFSSPIFGDMFLLEIDQAIEHLYGKVFVSYIRRYVLTVNIVQERKKLGLSFRLLYSEICSYCYTIHGIVDAIKDGFSSPIFGDMFLLT